MKYNGGCQVLGEEANEELLFNGYSFSFGRWKSSVDLLRNNVNIFNPSELYT